MILSMRLNRAERMRKGHRVTGEWKVELAAGIVIVLVAIVVTALIYWWAQ